MTKISFLSNFLLYTISEGGMLENTFEISERLPNSNSEVPIIIVFRCTIRAILYNIK